jgi:hypothetical protein
MIKILKSVIKISKELVNQVYVNIQVLLPFQESLMIRYCYCFNIKRFDDWKESKTNVGGSNLLRILINNYKMSRIGKNPIVIPAG